MIAFMQTISLTSGIIMGISPVDSAHLNFPDWISIPYTSDDSIEWGLHETHVLQCVGLFSAPVQPRCFSCTHIFTCINSADAYIWGVQKDYAEGRRAVWKLTVTSVLFCAIMH